MSSVVGMSACTSQPTCDFESHPFAFIIYLAAASSRSTRRRILPMLLFGNAVRK
jgi:hypothetical protein